MQESTAQSILSLIPSPCNQRPISSSSWHLFITLYCVDLFWTASVSVTIIFAQSACTHNNSVVLQGPQQFIATVVAMLFTRKNVHTSANIFLTRSQLHWESEHRLEYTFIFLDNVVGVTVIQEDSNRYNSDEILSYFAWARVT